MSDTMGLVIDPLFEEQPAPPEPRDMSYERWKALERRSWTPWEMLNDERPEPVLND